MQVVELQGVKVDDNSAGVPVAEGTALERTPSALNLPSQKDASRDGTVNGATVCMIYGCATIIFLIIYLVNGGLDARCDRPLPMWLLINVIVGFGGCGAACLCLCIVARCASDEPRTTNLGHVCLAFASLGSIAPFVLYVLGNIFLWSTFPSDSATLANQTRGEDTIADGLGCDPGLYWAIRGYMVFTFVVLGLACLSISLLWWACRALRGISGTSSRGTRR